MQMTPWGREDRSGGRASQGASAGARSALLSSEGGGGREKERGCVDRDVLSWGESKRGGEAGGTMTPWWADRGNAILQGGIRSNQGVDGRSNQGVDGHTARTPQPGTEESTVSWAGTAGVIGSRLTTCDDQRGRGTGRGTGRVPGVRRRRGRCCARWRGPTPRPGPP
jgi:hypothetical protein